MTNIKFIYCKDCYYYVPDLSQCYGQKHCPVVDPNDHCEDFKPCNNMVNSDNIIFKSTENQKIYSDMKLIKDAINDPNKNGFDICRLIKSITDEYDFKEGEE